MHPHHQQRHRTILLRLCTAHHLPDSVAEEAMTRLVEGTKHYGEFNHHKPPSWGGGRACGLWVDAGARYCSCCGEALVYDPQAEAWPELLDALNQAAAAIERADLGIEEPTEDERDALAEVVLNLALTLLATARWREVRQQAAEEAAR